MVSIRSSALVMSVFELYVADIAATTVHSIAIGWEPLGNPLRSCSVEPSIFRCFCIDLKKFSFSELVGSSPLIKRKQVSRKSDFSASSSIG